MRKMFLVCILTLGASSLGLDSGQSSPWITSIKYQQTKLDADVFLDIHVGLLQPGKAGYPCTGSSTLTLDSPFGNGDVTSIDGNADVNPNHLVPKEEAGAGVLFHIPVGTGKDLPIGWETVTLKLNAHCTGSEESRSPVPVIVLRRYASTSEFSVDAPQPLWNRSGTDETLSFNITTSWPSSIINLTIRDDGDDPGTHGNIVTAPYNDKGDSYTHAITVKTTVPLVSGRKYKYDLQFRAGQVNTTPLKPLGDFTLQGAPTQEYVLTRFPKPEELAVNDSSKDFTFQAQTSDNGTLEAIFDVLKVNGSKTVHGILSTDGSIYTFTFTIPKKEIPDDGPYPFHLEGTRKATNKPLEVKDQQAVLQLVVSTQARLGDPIGLGLSKDNANVVVSYCLSKETQTVVDIYADPAMKVEGQGTQVKDDSFHCNAGATMAYTAAISLKEYNDKVASSKVPTSGAPAVKSGTATTPPQVPLRLDIIDKSSKDRVLKTLTIAGVFIPKAADPKALVDALTTLSKKPTSDAKAAATKTLTDTYGLDQTTIDSLVKIGQKTNGAANTIGSVLGTLGKSFIGAYFGIPTTTPTK